MNKLKLRVVKWLAQGYILLSGQDSNPALSDAIKGQRQDEFGMGVVLVLTSRLAPA